MICSSCGRDINAIGQDNVSEIPGKPLCQDCAGMDNDNGYPEPKAKKIETIYGYPVDKLVILAETLRLTGMSVEEFRSRTDLVKYGFEMGKDHTLRSIKVQVVHVGKEASKDDEV